MTRSSHLILFIIAAVIGRVDITAAQEIPFTHITTEDGLSQNNVWAILKDHKGFMWFGTDDGLNRFDGYSFSVYHHSPADSLSISSNAITCLYEDSQQRMWVGTKTGLNQYDRQKDKFINYFSDVSDRDNLIKTICEDEKHNIWIGTSGGLKLIDTKNKKLIPFLTGDADPYNLLHTSIRNIIYDEQLWIAVDSGLVSYHADENLFEIFKPFPKDQRKNRLSSVQNDNGRLWLGSFENGLFEFDKRRKTFKNFRHQEGNTNSIIGNEVTKCVVIGKQLWICSPLGLSIMDLTTGNFNNLQHDKQDPSSLSFNSIAEILKDNQGIIWLGSRAGVNVYSEGASKFAHYKHNAGVKDGLSENTICRITENAAGDILIGTDGGGLNIFNPQTKKFTNITHDPANPNSISNNKVLSLLNDSNGGLWIGTWEGGLNYYDPKTKKYKHYFKDAANLAGLSSNNIFYLYEDADGDIWICTWGGGICKVDAKTKTISRFPTDDKTFPELSSHIIVVVTAYQDKQGILWFGSQERGVYRYDKKRNRITKFIHNRLDPQTIGASNANVIFEDSKNRLWFGTDGAGLNLFNRETETFTHFRMHDGLPSDAIVGIVEDDKGYLWISTSNGIAKIKVITSQGKIKLESKIFDNTDGLQDRQFNRWAYLKSKTGYLYFGGTNGFNMFHPDSIQENGFVPPVIISGFSLFNKTVLPGTSVLEKSITETQSLTLNYDKSVISFDFVALNFMHPEKNQYAFYLENFDSGWNYVGNQRKATYTNLDPGDYVFKVKASNNDGVWNEVGTSIYLTILPPYWKTLWFRALAIFIILICAYMLYRIRLRYLIDQRIELARQVKQRTHELVERNTELIEKVDEIKSQNTILNQQKFEIAEKNNEIQAQNEELTTQKDHISYQREELEKTQAKLQRINERLELLVNHRTKRLRLTIKELDKTVMELDRFVYSASHDLSAPLKSIRGLVNVGKLEKDYSRVNEYYQYIENSIDKLEKVIQSMVEFSRNSNLEVRSEPIILHGLVNEVLKTLTFWQEAGRIEFKIDIPDNIIIYSDYQRLKNIFQNMVSNSMKYADFDKPNPFIRFEYSEKGDHHLITITDNGIGIAKENIDKIFHMYFRATQRSDGSGLGLYIVKETITKLGGEISVRSVFNMETSFLIKVPKKI
jgi:ligand-binding sensor domain-containing protein/signal transduction histidine kinase